MKIDPASNAILTSEEITDLIRRRNRKQPVIVVVKKTFRYSDVFFYNPLCRNSVIRNIIMESGITVKPKVFLV